jgi:hypothetical protein
MHTHVSPARSFLALVLVAASFAPASARAQASKSFTVDLRTTINAPPRDVWRAISALESWDRFFSPITSTDVLSRSPYTRRLNVAGGVKIVERTLSISPAAMSMDYVITESTLPFTDYRSTMSVSAVPSGAELRWQCTATAVNTVAESRAGVEGFYNGVFAGLHALFRQ